MSNDPSQDQDFLNAAPHEQHAYLMATDADYAKASPQDQVAYLSHVSPKLSQTQFEKDRPGHGITMEGMGTAALGSVKKLGTGLLGMLDPTQGLSGAGLTSIGLNPRSGSVDDRLGEVPIVNAVKEAKAGWQRGDNYPGGRTGEATASALGSFVGESGQGAAEHAARGEGGAILGEAAVPAAVAIGAPLMRPIGRVARNRVADALIEPGGKPKPGARLALGSDRARALGEILKPEDAAYERKAQDLMRRGKEQDALDRKAARDAKANAPKPSPFAGATSSGESVGTPIELPAPREQAPMPMVRSAAPEAESIGTQIFPEPREPLPGDKPGAMWSIGREKVLPAAAQRGTPGAVDVMRNIGKPILLTPREGVGYPHPSEFKAARGRMQEESVGTPMPSAEPQHGLNLTGSEVAPERRVNGGEPPEGTPERRRNVYDIYKSNVGPTPGEQLEQEIRARGNKPSRFSEGEVRRYIAQDAKRYEEFRNADQKTQDAMIVKAAREMEKR